MTDEEAPTPQGGQLRDEAADWFAIMRGPEAKSRRAEFEAWLARGALHRSAYNRIAEVFSMGKGLKADAARATPIIPQPSRSLRRSGAILSAVVITIAGGWLWVGPLFRGAPVPVGPNIVADHQSVPGAPTQFATRLGEIRQFRLPDGSTVILDTDSLLTLSYGSTIRSLRLARGRARFTVAHEMRPFVVTAGEGTITARGTIFDVDVASNNKVEVHLIRGTIDVDMPSKPSREGAKRQVQRLVAGEQIAFADQSVSPIEKIHADNSENWPNAMRDFDKARLADVIAEANRYSMTRIVIKSEEVGDLRVSGSFRINDTGKLADRLAVLFGLVADRNNPGVIILRRP